MDWRTYLEGEGKGEIFYMDAEALYYQGEDFYEQKCYQEAWSAFHDAFHASTGPIERSQCLNYMGCCQIALQNYEEAMRLFDEALKLSPRWERLYFNKGRVFRDTGKMEEARSCFQTAVELNPDNADCWYYLGTYYKHTSSYEEAISCYKKSLELNNEEPEAHNDLGIMYWKCGQFEQALHEFEEAIKTDANYTDALWNKGQALSKLNRTNEAIMWYEFCLSKEPTDTKAMLELARLFYYKRKNKAKAQDLIQKVLELNPNEPL